MATYSNSANLKARPRERKRTETRDAASQNVSKRISLPLFLSFTLLDSFSNASAMAERGCCITTRSSISGILHSLRSNPLISKFDLIIVEMSKTREMGRVFVLRWNIPYKCGVPKVPNSITKRFVSSKHIIKRNVHRC